MAVTRPSLCITCGLPAASVHSFNRLEDGEVCPTCRDRLLDALPPPFPGFGHMLDQASEKRRRRPTKAMAPSPTAAPARKPSRSSKRESK